MRVEPTGITEYPLRAFQRDYWAFHGAAPTSPGTHIWFGVDLRGELDRDVLEAALGELRRCHPILRTTYAPHDGVVYQRVASTSELPLVSITRSPLRVTSTSELVGELARAPFELGRGPCWRVLLIGDPADAAHHIVLFDVHHIGWDALSSPIALGELGATYASLANGEASPRPIPEELSYIDLAHALDRHGTTPAGLADRRFWREALAGQPTGARPPSGMQSARGTLSAATLCRLQQVCEDMQATVFVACLAALARLLDEPELCIEVPIAERRYDERLARSLGPFVHCVIVRAAAAATMRDLLPRMKEALAAALEHRRVAATDVASHHQRRVGINYLKTPPLPFGHMVSFGPGLRAMGFQPASETDSQYELFVYIRGTSVAVFGRAEQYTTEACERLLGQYLALLESV